MVPSKRRLSGQVSALIKEGALPLSKEDVASLEEELAGLLSGRDELQELTAQLQDPETARLARDWFAGRTRDLTVVLELHRFALARRRGPEPWRAPALLERLHAEGFSFRKALIALQLEAQEDLPSDRTVARRWHELTSKASGPRAS